MVRRHLRGLAALIAALALTTAHADPAKYTLDELQALDKQSAWQELYDHAGDIAPSKRDPKWQALVEHAVAGLLDKLEARERDAAQLVDVATRAYPQLKASKAFMARRADFGVRGLEVCEQAEHDAGEQHADVPTCAARFVAFADEDPTNTDLAWRAGVAIARFHPTAAVVFLRRGLVKNPKACTDKALVAPVGMALSEKPSDPVVADARAIAFELCWDALKESVLDRFSAGAADFRRNTCAPLKKKPNALSPLSIRQCDALKP